MADMDIIFEILHTGLPYDAADGDSEKISNSAISPIPASLALELPSALIVMMLG
jgi:hypothetical protein